MVSANPWNIAEGLIDGFWLMVYALYMGLSNEHEQFNILPKLTDCLNHPNGFWLMAHALFLLFSAAKTVIILLSDGLNHPVVYA
jgi:hypothetical protein